VVRTVRRIAAISAAVTVLACAAPGAARVYTMKECIDLALSNNTTLAQAREGLTGADADVLSSWSSVLPKVSGSVSTGKTLVVADGDDTTGENASGSVSLSQTLFDGSTFASISATRHGREAESLALEDTRRGIVFNTRQAYYELLKARALRDVQSEAVELAREQLRKTESLFELGSASRSDLLKAQVQVGQSELALISAQRVAETARASLCLTIGIGVTSDVQVEDPPEAEWQDDIEAYDLEDALKRRPDVQAAEEALLSAKRSLLAAKADRWPSLRFSMSYSRSQDSLGDLFQDMGDDYSRSMSLSLSVPIFNGLATKASIDRRKSTLRTYELSLHDVKQQAEYEIETTRLYLREQGERVQVSEKAVEQAEEDLRVSEERFRLRAASMLELIDARVAYSQARVDMVEARYDHEIAKAELELALGL
jgi:outer membrane protein